MCQLDLLSQMALHGDEVSTLAYDKDDRNVHVVLRPSIPHLEIVVLRNMAEEVRENMVGFVL